MVKITNNPLSNKKSTRRLISLLVDSAWRQIRIGYGKGQNTRR